VAWKKNADGTWPDFETRQKTWTGFPREFIQHHGRGKKPTVWQIMILNDQSHFHKGTRVVTRHGQQGGVMQETSYVGKVKNAGKSNEISAHEDALAEARRDIRKKWDFEGFDEYTTVSTGTAETGYGIEKVNMDRRNEDISIHALLTRLPGSFCLYKPENNLYDQKKLLEKANKGEVYYTLKRDGVAKWVVVDWYGNIQIYSRRSRAFQDTEGPEELPDGTLDWSKAIPWAHRFPHIVEAVKALELPQGTMLACELVAPDIKDDFAYVSGLTKGYTGRALEDMKKGGLPKLYWWDIPFFQGEDLASTWKIKDRYTLMEQLWAQADTDESNSAGWAVREHIQLVQKVNFKNPDEAIDYAKKHKIEGFVVVDPDAIYGDRAWNLKGKPDRPSSCAKLKPRFEDDFIAMFDPDKGLGQWGTGKHERDKKVKLPSGEEVIHGGVGCVTLFQKNTKGELVRICDCASGMDYEFQSKLRKEDFPMVWQVEYTERTYISEGEKTNALRHPTFVRVRTDKGPDECVNKLLQDM